VIVADTNIVSEIMRPDPASAVLEWIAGIEVDNLTISVITVTEIEHGLARLPDGHRKRDLVTRWRQVLNTYADSILEYGTEAAHAAADILAERDNMGHPISLADAQIAGICRTHACRLATRNTKDFIGLGLDLIDPFQRD